MGPLATFTAQLQAQLSVWCPVGAGQMAAIFAVDVDYTLSLNCWRSYKEALSPAPTPGTLYLQGNKYKGHYWWLFWWGGGWHYGGSQ